jgi:hypothetical protein
MQHGTTVKIVKEGLMPNEIHSNFIKIRPVEAELFHADGRTDKHDKELFFALLLKGIKMSHSIE